MDRRKREKERERKKEKKEEEKTRSVVKKNISNKKIRPNTRDDVQKKKSTNKRFKNTFSLSKRRKQRHNNNTLCVVKEEEDTNTMLSSPSSFLACRRAVAPGFGLPVSVALSTKSSSSRTNNHHRHHHRRGEKSSFFAFGRAPGGSRRRCVSSVVVVAKAASDEKGEAKVKSYMDAGKKAKESKGLKNSFYAGSFKPIKFTKSGTQFTKRPSSNSAKFKVPKKKPLAKKKPMTLSNPIKIKPVKPQPRKPMKFNATVKPKQSFTPKAKTVKIKKTKTFVSKKKRSPVKSQYTIKKQSVKPTKQIVNKSAVYAAKVPAKKKAQTVVVSNLFASLSGVKKGGAVMTKRATVSPTAKIAAPVQMKKKEERSSSPSTSSSSSSSIPSFSSNNMSEEEIGTYGLIAAFALASFSSLVVMPVALSNVFELIGLGVTGYFLFSKYFRDDDLGLSETLDEVETQTGLDVKELTNSTVELVEDTMSTVSSNMKKKKSYPKKSDSPNESEVKEEEGKKDDE